MMSDTSHQREVADLRKAGLNPILSANKGASTPSSSAARMENIAGPAVTSALDSARLRKEIRAVDSQIGLNASQAQAAMGAAMRDASTAKQNDATTKVIEGTMQNVFDKSKAEGGKAQEYLNNKQYYDFMNRIQAGMNNASSAADAVWKLMPTGGVKIPRNSTLIKNKTGEILRERGNFFSTKP